VGVLGETNTISTATGTALDVENTTLGSFGMQFLSISAGTGSVGPVNGIVLSNTGPDGTVTVTGDGSTSGSGGTIQNASGDAISLNASLSGSVNADFQWMNITNNQRGIVCTNTGSDRANCAVSNNTLTGQTAGSIVISNGAAAPCSSTGSRLIAHIRNNQVNQPTSGTASAIGVALGKCNDLSALVIDGNVIVNNGQGDGINVTAPDIGTMPHNAPIWVTNNSVSMSANGRHGISLAVGATSSSFGACFRVGITEQPTIPIGGPNSATPGPAGSFAISMAQSGPATVMLEATNPDPNYAAILTDATQALTAKNPGSTPINTIGSFSAVGDGTCYQPSVNVNL
jgi:hypothetical protein